MAPPAHPECLQRAFGDVGDIADGLHVRDVRSIPLVPVEDRRGLLLVQLQSIPNGVGFVVLATYELPAAWAQSFRATRASFTIAVRNLWKATGFSGIDPEANYFEGATGIVSNFQTAAPPTYWTFRLNVGF